MYTPLYHPQNVGGGGDYSPVARGPCSSFWEVSAEVSAPTAFYLAAALAAL